MVTKIKPGRKTAAKKPTASTTGDKKSAAKKKASAKKRTVLNKAYLKTVIANLEAMKTALEKVNFINPAMAIGQALPHLRAALEGIPGGWDSTRK